MSKTIEELVELYRCAYSELDYVAPFQDCEVYERAGVIAVVRALRDEIAFTNDNCGVCVSIRRIFNDILGDAGNEKAAGGTPAHSRGSGYQTRPVAPKPAAPTTVPETCEWTMDTHPDSDPRYETACGDAWCSVLGGAPKQDNYSFCPSCGLPIKFKEKS